MGPLPIQTNRLRNVTDVVSWQLCLGCGACAYACPEKKLTLVDFAAHGIRPVAVQDRCDGCSDCLSVCPGIGMAHARQDRADRRIAALSEAWGPVLEIWEGYAADAEIRFGGSSGGLASALSLYCIEQAGMAGVLHTGSDGEKRYKNKTVFSTTKSEILSRTGSRYSPASPCEGLQLIEDATGACAFVGKPCDVEALRKAQVVRPKLGQSIGVAIAVFCAGTPSTKGTVDLLAKHEIDPEQVEEIRYRGRGWPGSFSVRLKGSTQFRQLASYEEAWGFLQQYRPYRCHLCPDGTGEFADISCGDPWYREIEEGEPGKSLLLVRTERGRQLVKGALAAGYIRLEAVEPDVLNLSQAQLLGKRGAIWGRVAAMRAFGIPAPHFDGFALFSNWLKQPLFHKVRSIVGTARRIVQRKYYRPLAGLERPSHRSASDRGIHVVPPRENAQRTKA